MANISICAFGDSVMKGTVLESTNPVKYALPTQSFTDITANSLGINIDNFARFGSTISTGEKILLRHLGSIYSYPYTLLKFGGNDCDYSWGAVATSPNGKHLPLTPLKDFLVKYERMVKMVRSLGSVPIIVSLAPVQSEAYFRHITRNFSEQERDNVLKWLGGTPNFISEWHEMYNIQLMGLAARLGVNTIDITSPFYSSPGYGKLLCEDGAHPNLEGQKIMADALSYGLSYIYASPLLSAKAV